MQGLELRFENPAVSHLAEFTEEFGTDLVTCTLGLPARQCSFLSLSLLWVWGTQTLLCRETQTSVNQQGKKQQLKRVVSWEKERRNLYGNVRTIGGVINLLKGIWKSNPCDQTYRSKYSIQVGWEFELPCDLLPWLSLRKKCKEMMLLWVNVPVSTLISISLYRNIWGNWINFQTNMEFAYRVFILFILSEVLVNPKPDHLPQAPYD